MPHTDPTSDEPVLLFKTVGATFDGEVWPFLGMRPGFIPIQLSGPPAEDDVITQCLIRDGWTKQGPVPEQVPPPATDYSIALTPEGRYRLDRRGREFKYGNGVEPTLWLDAVREWGGVIGVYDPTPGVEVRGVELVEALARGGCLLINIPLVTEH